MPGQQLLSAVQRSLVESAPATRPTCSAWRTRRPADCCWSTPWPIVFIALAGRPSWWVRAHLAARSCSTRATPDPATSSSARHAPEPAGPRGVAAPLRRATPAALARHRRGTRTSRASLPISCCRRSTPTLLVFWHTDPDHTSHARGHRAPRPSVAARRRRQPWRDPRRLRSARPARLDRGCRDFRSRLVDGQRRVQPARDLAGLLADGAVAENGGSVFVYTSDPAAVSAIRKLDYVGPIFTRDGREQTFPLALVGLDGPRAPDIVFSLAWSDAAGRRRARVAIGAHSQTGRGPRDDQSLRAAQHAGVRRAGFPRWLAGSRAGRQYRHCADADARAPARPGHAVRGSRARRSAARRARWTRRLGHAPGAGHFSARGRAWTQRLWFESVGAQASVTGGAVGE